MRLDLVRVKMASGDKDGSGLFGNLPGCAGDPREHLGSIHDGGEKGEKGEKELLASEHRARMA